MAKHHQESEEERSQAVNPSLKVLELCGDGWDSELRRVRAYHRVLDLLPCIYLQTMNKDVAFPCSML
jgi:hypothetical protein